jgi:hypothetical protein
MHYVSSAYFNSVSAFSNSFFLGSTINNASYVFTTARIHKDRLPAAVEALNTLSWAKRGSKTNTFSFSILFWGILFILSESYSYTLCISLSFSTFFLA